MNVDIGYSGMFIIQRVVSFIFGVFIIFVGYKFHEDIPKVGATGEAVNIGGNFYPTSLVLWTFWVITGVVVYTLGLMLILYFRVPYGHLMYVVNVGFMFILGLAGVFFGRTLALKIMAGLGIAVGVLQLVVAMNIWKDFSFYQIRLRIKIH